MAHTTHNAHNAPGLKTMPSFPGLPTQLSMYCPRSSSSSDSSTFNATRWLRRFGHQRPQGPHFELGRHHPLSHLLRSTARWRRRRFPTVARIRGSGKFA